LKIEKNNLLKLLRKYEHLFDGTLGNFEKSHVKINLKEDANPYHAKDFPVPKNHHDTLTHQIERLVSLGVLKYAVTQNGLYLHSIYLR
jgi:hypothetical protein